MQTGQVRSRPLSEQVVSHLSRQARWKTCMQRVKVRSTAQRIVSMQMGQSTVGNGNDDDGEEEGEEGEEGEEARGKVK